MIMYARNKKKIPKKTDHLTICPSYGTVSQLPDAIYLANTYPRPPKRLLVIINELGIIISILSFNNDRHFANALLARFHPQGVGLGMRKERGRNSWLKITKLNERFC